MKYAVYILAGEDKNKKKDLVKDKSTGAMLKAAAAGALADLVGVDFYDPVAKSLEDEKSVAISGKTITGMEYNTSLLFGTRYKMDDQENHIMEDVYTTMLLHTLTVKGILDPNNEMLLIPGIKDLLKKKDLSRVWKWANTPFPEDPNDKENEYYRDVIAISYSTDQDRYRALGMVNASVGSYEEHFDKDGLGHFKLVVNAVIDSSLAPANLDQAPDVELLGPTFNISLTQAAKAIGTATTVAKKGLDKGIEVAEKFGADTEKAKKFSKGMQKAVYDPFGDTFGDGGKIDLTPTNIANQIEREADMVKMAKDKAVKTDTTEVKTTKTKDGKNDVITKTTTNPDGSKVIEITTKDAKGNVISVETKKVKA